jgi:hypothetical protein
VILEHMRVELGYETLGEKFARERGRSRRQALEQNRGKVIDGFEDLLADVGRKWETG